VLETADEPLSPKEITEILNAKGMNISYGAVRELLSQMVKDGQVKNLGRGQYLLPDNSQNSADNADILTNGKGDFSLSGMSGHFREESSADGRGAE
jgi:repressor of nif and glnA expression